MTLKSAETSNIRKLHYLPLAETGKLALGGKHISNWWPLVFLTVDGPAAVSHDSQ